MSTPNTPGPDRSEPPEPRSWAPPSSSWQDPQPSQPETRPGAADGEQAPTAPQDPAAGASPDAPVTPPAVDAWNEAPPTSSEGWPATPPAADAWGSTPDPSTSAWGETPDPGSSGWGAPGQAPGDPGTPAWGVPGQSEGTPGWGAPGQAQGGTPGHGPTGHGGADGAGAGPTGGPGQPGRPSQPGQFPPYAASWAPSPQPGVIPLRPLQLGDLFDGTFRAIRSNPAVMFGFSVALLAVLSLISAAVQAAFSSSFYSIIDDPQAALDDDLTSTASGLSSLLVSNLGTSALTMLATAILSGILALTVSDAVLGRVTALGDAWSRVRPRLWPLIGTSVLMGIIQTVAVVVVLALFAIPLVIAFSSNSDPGAVAVLPLLLGIPVALAAMLFLTVRLLFAPMTVVLEDLGPIAALKRSWALTRGGFWRICGRLLLIGLITAVASGIIGGAVGILGSLFMFITSPAVGVAITAFLTGTASGLVVPIAAAFETLMYVDERMRRENLAPVLARAAQEG